MMTSANSLSTIAIAFEGVRWLIRASKDNLARTNTRTMRTSLAKTA